MIDNPIPKDPPIIPDNIYNAPIKIWWVEKRIKVECIHQKKVELNKRNEKRRMKREEKGKRTEWKD